MLSSSLWSRGLILTGTRWNVVGVLCVGLFLTILPIPRHEVLSPPGRHDHWYAVARIVRSDVVISSIGRVLV